MDSLNDTTFALAVDADPKRAIVKEVGDVKQAEFYPQEKHSYWNNECNWSARLVDDDPTGGTVTQKDDGSIEWARGGRRACFSHKETEDENGAAVFDVILESPPASNVIAFTIQTKGVEFHYQPPLNKDKAVRPEAVAFTETEAFDKEGKQIHFRPENVVGSYAVFMANPKPNYVGGPEYRSGKIGHIYRPRVSDAKGTQVWGDLNIDVDAGLMTVTIPQDFLDAAVYPVTVDPDYGYTSLGASEDATDGSSIGYNAGSFSGATGSTANGAYWYGRATSSVSKTVEVGLYANGSGLPTTQHFKFSATCALTTTKTQYAIAGSNAFSFTYGTTLWICSACNLGSGWRCEYDSSAGYDMSYKDGTTLPSPTWGAEAGSGTWKLSFYFTYAEPAGGAAIIGPSRIPNPNVGPMALRWTYRRPQYIPFAPAQTAITGAASITEADDTLAATGTLLIQGTASITEAGDTLAATGTLIIQGVASITEAGDTLAATGTLIIQGVAAITEEGDTLAATGTATITGIADITEADDTLAAEGTITQPTPTPSPNPPNTIAAAFVEEYQPEKPKAKKKRKLKPAPDVIREYTVLNYVDGIPQMQLVKTTRWGPFDQGDEEDLRRIMELLDAMDD